MAVIAFGNMNAGGAIAVSVRRRLIAEPHRCD